VTSFRAGSWPAYGAAASRQISVAPDRIIGTSSGATLPITLSGTARITTSAADSASIFEVVVSPRFARFSTPFGLTST